MVNDLCEWVKNHPLAKDSRVLLPFSPEWPAIEDKIWKHNLMPIELLKKVGIKSFFEVEGKDEDESEV
jgi:hypothetical protein